VSVLPDDGGVRLSDIERAAQGLRSLKARHADVYRSVVESVIPESVAVPVSMLVDGSRSAEDLVVELASALLERRGESGLRPTDRDLAWARIVLSNDIRWVTQLVEVQTGKRRLAAPSTISGSTEGFPAEQFGLTEDDLRVLRAQLAPFAEDWDDPGMDAYDELFERLSRDAEPR